MKDVSQKEADLLLALQRGITLEERPFDRLGRGLGLSGKEVVDRAAEYLRKGTARRFGGVFDSRSLGYDSTLCAVDVPEDALERAAAILAPHPGVTHCYQREGRPNLWFTLTAPAAVLRAELDKLAAALSPHALLSLPALKKFKIEAVFDVREGGPRRDKRQARTRGDKGRGHAVATLTEDERAVVRSLQGNVPLSEEPFRDVARGLNRNQAGLLALLRGWKETGVLRRVGLIMRHRELGFTANSMCVWKAAEAAVEQAGRAMAAHPEVTHCYERPSFDSFPYNLYAMIHAGAPEAARGVFRRLSEETGLRDGRMMVSLREFKKASPVFFCEDAE